MHRNLLLIGILLLAGGFSVLAQQKTVVNDAKAKQMLLGKHKLSVQWISWDYFGTASVTERRGTFYLKGEQRGRGEQTDDYVTVNGTITSISANEFRFNGKIAVRISHNNNGAECLRKGEMTFRITGKRKYWRLMEMQSPCGAETDYVDIFFK